MPKRNTEYILNINPCFTNDYFSGQNFNYKIILEFLNEYEEAKLPYKSLFM